MRIDKDDLHDRMLTYLAAHGAWSLTKVANHQVRYHTDQIADAINGMPEKDVTVAEAFAELAEAAGSGPRACSSCQSPLDIVPGEMPCPECGAKQ